VDFKLQTKSCSPSQANKWAGSAEVGVQGVDINIDMPTHILVASAAPDKEEPRIVSSFVS